MSNFLLTIGDHIIMPGDLLPLAFLKQFPLAVDFFGSDQYAYVLVDPDAPYPNNPIYKYILHLMVVNNTQTIVPYMSPNPPPGSPPHRYILYLYRQSRPIAPSAPPRRNFNLAEFVKSNGLQEIYSTYFLAQHN
jgi:phosphatidylethanolamine-binding protein